jgi:3-deoxy-manno-octulosonate cytidylyltransferase (CMP-KDO synthetase)
MKIIGIIPARFASTRFPGKPLIEIEGRSMLQRVYEQAKKSKLLNDVIVATDDNRIEAHVKKFGGKVVMTSSKHKSGTDRCAEAIKRSGNKFDVAINIQGDEPFIKPQQIDLVCACFRSKNVEIATLIKKINGPEELLNANIPKVIINKNKQAIYFSRTAIPFYRNSGDADEWLKKHIYYKHIGIYGYKTAVLKEITQLKQSSLELAESLEQLRWIENGYKIFTAVTTHESLAIDTPKDLKKIKK